MVNRQANNLLEMIAGTIGVFALTAECESFTYRHMMIGTILTLYVLQGLRRHKNRFESILYCAICSLLILLSIGKLLDWLRDNYFRHVVSRDGTLALVWMILLIILFIIERNTHNKDEVTYEVR